MKYNILNTVFLILMLFASARGYDALYLSALVVSLAIYLYLLVAGLMLPNSKTLIYDFYITQYDYQKKKDYVKRNFDYLGIVFNERYSSATLILFFVFCMLACSANSRPDLLLMTVSALVVLQIVHIVVSYRSVMRDG